MADEMLRVAGRGEDGTAKAMQTDNSGLLKIKQTPISLATTHQNAVNVSGNGTAIVISGYSAIAFHVFGTFVGKVVFEGNIIPGVWVTLPVVNGNGIFVDNATTGGIYKADISGYREVRARVEWTSGTSVTVQSIATLSGSTKDLTVNLSRQNVLLREMSDNYQVGKNISFYGASTRPSTDPSIIVPVNYSNHTKKTLFLVNNFDVDVKVISYYKYTKVAANEFIEKKVVNIPITANGGTGRLSYLDYPELLDPFVGMMVEIQAATTNPTTGTMKLHWMGGN
jgi:hypothetical protein